MALLTTMMGCPCCMALRSIVIGSCQLTTSHSGFAQLFSGSVIRWYNVHGGSAPGGLEVMMCVMGRATRIVYFFSIGVTGNVPGGMLALGRRSTLYTNLVGQLRGLQYLYHTCLWW